MIILSAATVAPENKENSAKNIPPSFLPAAFCEIEAESETDYDFIDRFSFSLGSKTKKKSERLS